MEFVNHFTGTTPNIDLPAHTKSIIAAYNDYTYGIARGRAVWVDVRGIGTLEG